MKRPVLAAVLATAAAGSAAKAADLSFATTGTGGFYTSGTADVVNGYVVNLDNATVDGYAILGLAYNLGGSQSYRLDFGGIDFLSNPYPSNPGDEDTNTV